MDVVELVGSPLIVDPDARFLENVVTSQAARHLPPLIARDIGEAEEKLRNYGDSISSIFVNPEVSPCKGVTVLRQAQRLKAGLPMFLLSGGTDEIEFGNATLESLGIQQVLKKPLNYQELLSVVSPLLEDPLLQIMLQNDEEGLLPAEVIGTESEFIAVRAASFLMGSRSIFDVYIRINSQRYLLVLRKGDQFSYERISSYIKKGITRFYLKKEAHEGYIKYCDQLASVLLSSARVPNPIRMMHAYHFGEQATAFFKNHGVDHSVVDVSRRFVDSVRNTVLKLEVPIGSSLWDYLNSVDDVDHAVSCTMIAGIIGSAMGFQSEAVWRALGVAAFFHDAGLAELPDDFRHIHDEDESKMDVNEARQYRHHPVLGASMLKGFADIPEAALLAIRHHHERRDGRGFPLGLEAGKIPMIAEVIGIADELSRFIKKYHFAGVSARADLFRSFVEDRFSAGVIGAFDKAFLISKGT